MKKLFQIRSGSFINAEQILVMKIGKRHCCFAIADISGKSLDQLAYYSDEEINESSLINLFNNNPELNNSFKKVIVCYDFSQTVLIPQPYFKQDETFNILKSTYGFNDHPKILTQVIPDQEFSIANAVPKEISEWLNKRFPSAVSFHEYSAIQNNGQNANFWIDFRTDEFSLIAAKENKLLLAQTFLYSNPDDVIYYLLKTSQQFSISPKEVKLLLSGLIEKESALFKELYQYFLNIEFRNADWQIENNEYPSHFFTSLKDLIKCAS